MARPPHPLLSRVNIAETALRVLDEEGTDALTVRRVAERLGVRAQSLYNHVASKDEILDAITEIIDGAIDTAALADPDWAARAHARSREMAARWTIANQSREFVRIYEDLAAGRPVALTEGLKPDHGRPPFPGRTVTAPWALRSPGMSA